MNIAVKDLNKLIILKALDNGYDIWYSESAKRQGGKRSLKYVRNGWEPDQQLKTTIQNAIKAATSKYDNVLSVEWKQGYMGGRGEYPFIQVIIQDTTSDLDANAEKQIATDQGKMANRIFNNNKIYLYHKETSYLGETFGLTYVDYRDKTKWLPSKGENLIYFEALTPNQIKAVQAAIGPQKTYNFLRQGYVDFKKTVFDKLMKVK